MQNASSTCPHCGSAQTKPLTRTKRRIFLLCLACGKTFAVKAPPD